MRIAESVKVILRMSEDKEICKICYSSHGDASRFGQRPSLTSSIRTRAHLTVN